MPRSLLLNEKLYFQDLLFMFDVSFIGYFHEITNYMMLVHSHFFWYDSHDYVSCTHFMSFIDLECQLCVSSYVS